MTLVESCLANVDAETCDRLRSRSDTRAASCLDRCGVCHSETFLVVDGTVRSEASHQAVLEAADGR
jgi:uncharacterized protein YuzB (UPF0349 family)